MAASPFPGDWQAKMNSNSAAMIDEMGDNKYTFRLHTDRIVIFSNTKEFTSFTVECSEKETKELYDIIEAAN